ncbi:MAG TPA: hypothetical protein VK564_07585 [Thermodesulfobacteriota bacterium]|nr:hypothetical protein [Thermodesulfobacteriota bacterium]
MHITTRSGRSFDTETDLNPAERHILQKLMAWETLVRSLEEFRQKKAEALQKGWNESGPVPESEALRVITDDMQERVWNRLKNK